MANDNPTWVSSSREVVERHYAASDAADLPGMLEPLADRIVWVEAHGSPLSGTYIGRDSVADGVFAAIQREWVEFDVAIDELISEGDRVVAVGTYSGTNRRTGMQFEARCVHLWEIKGGRAVRFEQVVDSARMLAAM